MTMTTFILLVLLTAYNVGSATLEQPKLCFPKGFTFGVATASYQIEGAWNESGKGESIWDHYTHMYPERVVDHKNADVADDSYHLYKTDVQLLKELGVQFYRFSISWPRILPSGFSNYINPNGVKYYNNLLFELQKNNIEPLVTMYHWDLPQSIQDLGGWTNPTTADYFVDYARVLFNIFGDRVLTWITFNEPITFCLQGYGGYDAPGHMSNGLEAYMCAHNVLRAHGMVYKMYNKEYRKKAGSIGITLNTPWMEPMTSSAEDQEAGETALQFMFGWYAHPIYSKDGDYPPVMRRRIDEISKRQNYPRSRLPRFTEEEVDYIRGSFDFLGYNHYTSVIATFSNKSSSKPNYYEDMGVNLSFRDDWPTTNSSWLRVVPWGFRKALNWIKNTYDNPKVIITENGASFGPGLNDERRKEYIEGYVRNLHGAVVEDGCDITAYTHWSLMDNFEWMRGYSERFGLYEVDYTVPNRTRTARSSAAYYSQLVKTGCIPTL